MLLGSADTPLNYSYPNIINLCCAECRWIRLSTLQHWIVLLIILHSITNAMVCDKHGIDRLVPQQISLDPMMCFWRPCTSWWWMWLMNVADDVFFGRQTPCFCFVSDNLCRCRCCLITSCLFANFSREFVQFMADVMVTKFFQVQRDCPPVYTFISMRVMRHCKSNFDFINSVPIFPVCLLEIKNHLR